MGFLDFFTGGSEGQLKRHTKRARNLNAQAEDREASLHWLASDGSEQAILGLLGRYNVTYEHQMKDLNEKTLVFDLLEGLGESVCGPIKIWARTAPQFARPLQLVQQFEGEASTVTFLVELLAAENDPFKPEKKRQILIRLAEFKDERVVPAVDPCLRDFDEGIRYAAVEAVLSQDDPTVQSSLAACLADDKEESNRLRVRIAEAFHLRSWAVGEHADIVAGRPPHGWMVQDGKMFPLG
jgi:HEAT repeat protein